MRLRQGLAVLLTLFATCIPASAQLAWPGGPVLCANFKTINIVATTAPQTIEIIAATASQRIFICGWDGGIYAAGQFTFRAGTGTNCATGGYDLAGPYQLAANGDGLVVTIGSQPVFWTAPSEAVCGRLSVNTTFSGRITLR